jgi:DnaJ-class molecular chaperone
VHQYNKHFGMSEKLLEELSRTAGVDFLALKQKYSSNSSGSIVSNESASEEVINAHNSLSKYAVCQVCQGQGIVKSVYNHIVMEKTCESCDGESIVLREAFDKEIKSMKS